MCAGSKFYCLVAFLCHLRFINCTQSWIFPHYSTADPSSNPHDVKLVWFPSVCTLAAVSSATFITHNMLLAPSCARRSERDCGGSVQPGTRGRHADVVFDKDAAANCWCLTRGGWTKEQSSLSDTSQFVCVGHIDRKRSWLMETWTDMWRRCNLTFVTQMKGYTWILSEP